MKTRVYLDLCCLNRPFDDQGQQRVRLETEAVQAILAEIQSGNLVWVQSNVLDLENSKNRELDRRDGVSLLLQAGGSGVIVGDMERLRGRELESLGFMEFDALHLACAESGKAELFVTTDDRLRRKANRLASGLRVKVVNPLDLFRASK